MYSRMLRRDLEAARVHATDLSEALIDIAQKRENRDLLGITYVALWVVVCSKSDSMMCATDTACTTLLKHRQGKASVIFHHDSFPDELSHSPVFDS